MTALQNSKSTVEEIISDTCQALIQVLQPIYLKFPDVVEFEKIANEFKDKWKFPLCLGVLNGKYIKIQEFASNFLNKNIVLYAACDANHKFIYVDIGFENSIRDPNMFFDTPFGMKLANDELLLPPPHRLSDMPIENPGLPHLFVGGQNVPKVDKILKQYPEELVIDGDTKNLINHRLNNVKNIFEDSFRMLKTRWRIVQDYKPDNERGKFSVIFKHQ